MFLTAITLQPIHLVLPTIVEWWAPLWVHAAVGMNSESIDDH
jgi:hypothetical protein